MFKAALEGSGRTLGFCLWSTLFVAAQGSEILADPDTRLLICALLWLHISSGAGASLQSLRD